MLLVWAAVAAGLLAGCAEPRTAPAVSAAEHSIRTRATNFLEKAILLKPDLDSAPGALDPLLMIEVANGTNALLPGSVAPMGEHWFVNPAQPAVYTNIGVTTLSGKPHARHAFVWFYAGPGENRLRIQGVAITLDDGGLPMLWEVLNDSSGLCIVYVAKALESRAATRFGAPLPSRWFSVERSAADSGRSVVARVLDDGPVAMGPIVQIAAGEPDIAAVICRCMPVQVKELVSTLTYTSLPLDILWSSPAFRKAAGRDLSRFIGDEEAGNRLEHALRLP